MTRILRVLVVSAAVAVALSLAAPAGAANPKLFGVVGPGFNISVRDANGVRVTNVEPGTYDIEVEDASEEHNFHLTGPGVNRATSVDFVGTVTWTVTLSNGTYVYICDPHATTMRGSFTVGPPPVSTPPPRPRTVKLVATVGPGATIALRRASGALATRLQPGLYSITVRDRSARQNFHLIGPGVNRRTGVSSRGTVTWQVRLKAATYRYVSDASRALRRSVRVG